MSALQNRVEVWLARPEEVSSDLLNAYRNVMTPDERAKEDRYMFDKDKLTCAVSRGMLRTMLSCYGNELPADWRFVTNEYGRPELEDAPFHFNLSHTTGLVACALTMDRDVGVDVETRARRTEGVDIAERFFSESEVQALRALPKAEQRPRFFRYWTLKESYIKARGMGLAIPLGDFSFDVEQSPPTISFAPSLPDDPTQWQFYADDVTDVHALAVATRSAAPLPISVRWVQPDPRDPTASL